MMNSRNALWAEAKEKTPPFTINTDDNQFNITFNRSWDLSRLPIPSPSIEGLIISADESVTPARLNIVIDHTVPDFDKCDMAFRQLLGKLNANFYGLYLSDVDQIIKKFESFLMAQNQPSRYAPKTLY